jgi:hypothetical protein
MTFRYTGIFASQGCLLVMILMILMIILIVFRRKEVEESLGENCDLGTLA